MKNVKNHRGDDGYFDKKDNGRWKPIQNLMKCEHCGYLWKYKGKLIKATCPSCGLKSKVLKIRE